ncbi:hypothetical protein NUW54_g14525 [Trametes sanguinea]|uniref:Uncharacterized protein n=1 Tax=Trametes sanguinea TaxID=158606 RepID=A0ACC1MBM8_9APHY|nr:hypothetical protein NUW54_g14525 [Trametes sanguinea]
MDVPTVPPLISCSPPSSAPASSSSSGSSSVHISHRSHKQHPSFVFRRRSLQRLQVLNVSTLISHRLSPSNNMADAESSSITDSSLAPSTTPTSILDSLPPHSSDRTASTDKVDRRASLGLIDAARVRFSKDFPSVVPNTCSPSVLTLLPAQFSSLLRSNSKSQRIRTVLATQVRLAPCTAPF